MASLPNPQHERFAQLVASEKAVTEAHRLAGYAPDASNAGKLMRRPDVGARVAELQAESLERQGISRERILDEAAAIAFVDMTGIAPDGTVEPGHRLTRAQGRAITSIEVLTDAHGRRTARVKFGDRLRALELLGKWSGLERPAPENHLHLHAPVESPLETIRARIDLLRARLETAPETFTQP